MRRKLLAAAAIAGLAALIVLCQFIGGLLKKNFSWNEDSRETSAEAMSKTTVILDPGHGGIDAGKTAINGTEEKDINLNIALKIKNKLKKEDIDVIMTREADERLGQTQKEDLKERVSLMNSKKPVLSVSIHQNSYHQENVSGAQVFYHSKSGEGERAAGILQEQLNLLQPDNPKKIKANDTYYILKNTEVPAVIAECGFLSNYAEAEKLADDAYQEEIAGAVAKGILLYIEEMR